MPAIFDFWLCSTNCSLLNRHFLTIIYYNLDCSLANHKSKCVIWTLLIINILRIGASHSSCGSTAKNDVQRKETYLMMILMNMMMMMMMLISLFFFSISVAVKEKAEYLNHYSMLWYRQKKSWYNLIMLTQWLSWERWQSLISVQLADAKLVDDIAQEPCMVAVNEGSMCKNRRFVRTG